MSAFLVSREHIAYLVQAAMTPRIVGRGEFNWCWGVPCNKYGVLSSTDFPTASAAGQMLWAENARSVNERYGENEPCPLYGRHVNLPGRVITNAQLLKACACYDYQACETDDYEHSESHAFIEALRDAAISSLPGWAEAAWDIEDRAPTPSLPK